MVGGPSRRDDRITGSAACLATSLGADDPIAPVLGPDHPDTLTTRANIASWIGRCGQPEEELLLFQELLPDRERVLGPDHPDTLAIRERIQQLSTPNGGPSGSP